MIRSFQFFLLILFLAQGCKSKSRVVDSAEEEKTVAIDPIYIKLSEYHRELSDSICSQAKWKGRNYFSVYFSNLDFYACLRKHNYDKFTEVMNMMMVTIPYDDVYYVQMLGFWDDLHRASSFEIFIELLKEDYLPETKGFNPYYKVYEYVYGRLVLPNIKNIEGIPKWEYLSQPDSRLPEYIDDNLTAYTNLKQLWSEGKIELYGVEHFRKDK